jgi:murein DD-endopeptidase MepM/ murein hydrolase activator NlpD
VNGPALAALRPVAGLVVLLAAASAARPRPAPTPDQGPALPLLNVKHVEMRGTLGARRLSAPFVGTQTNYLDTFAQSRGGGRRKHEAMDILAPRGTPVLAVDDGFVAKLFVSVPGGITVYQFDPSSTWCYYYAHLERWADGLREHQLVRRGDILGYVGTTGNAPKDTPHLHLAISHLTPEKHWWEGTPIDPYPVLAAKS